MNPLHSIIDRRPPLLALREALLAELGARLSTAAGERVLNLLTITVATWHSHLCRGDGHQDHLGRLVELLWRAAAKLTGATRPESKAEIFTWRDRALCAEAALYALVDAPHTFGAAASSFFHVPERLHEAVASALTLPGGLGGCRWQTALHPIGLVRKKASIHHRLDVMRGGEIPKRDGLYRGRIGTFHRGTVTLEAIADSPGEATMVKRYSSESLTVLRRAAEGDADLETYIRARVNLGGRAQDSWRALGWTDARGHRVDRRFRRLCVSIRGRDDLVDLEYLPAARSASMSGRTVYREVLFGGQFGTESFVYQHVPTR